MFIRNIRSYASPQPSESLHSFILRVLLRLGHSDFSGVLSKSGGWVHRPEIPYEMKEAFSSFKKTDLLSLYESYFMAFNSARLFDNPFNHLFGEDRLNRLTTSYSNIFHPTHSKGHQRSSFPIKYCNECIQYQIWKYGFGYFKAEWYGEQRCSVHEAELSSGSASLKEPPYEYIHKILQGRALESPVSFELAPSSKFRTVEDAKFAPCLQKEVIAFLGAKLDCFPTGYTELVDYGLFKAHERLAVSKLTFRNQLYFSPEVFYETLLEQDYESAFLFLSEQVDITAVQHIDEMVRSNRRVLFKSKTSDCSKCTIPKGIKNAYSCPASNLIHMNNESPNLNRFPLNVTDELLGELSRKVQAHQDLLGVRDGEIRVGQELRQSEEYARFGGKSAYKQHMDKSKMDICKIKMW